MSSRTSQGRKLFTFSNWTWQTSTRSRPPPKNSSKRNPSFIRCTTIGEFHYALALGNALSTRCSDIMYAKAERTTKQGYDTIFGTNVLGTHIQFNIARILTRPFAGHFYFTKLLLPALKAAAKGSPGTVRIVNLSSIAHYMSPSEGIRWSTLGPGMDAIPARKKLGVARLFGQSKLVKLHNFPSKFGGIS